VVSLLRRRGRLRQKKRVRDDMVDDLALAADGRPGGKRAGHAVPGDKEDDVAVAAAAAEAAATSDADRLWLEMYQVGQWGFGRLSFSVNPPPKAGYVATARDGDGEGCESDV
jgi:hypothetical protein